jgi:hypothetical protein
MDYTRPTFTMPARPEIPHFARPLKGGTGNWHEKIPGGAQYNQLLQEQQARFAARTPPHTNLGDGSGGGSIDWGHMTDGNSIYDRVPQPGMGIGRGIGPGFAPPLDFGGAGHITFGHPLSGGSDTYGPSPVPPAGFLATLRNLGLL